LDINKIISSYYLINLLSEALALYFHSSQHQKYYNVIMKLAN